jgi:hypothetical protein
MESMKQAAGTFAPGFLLLAICAVTAAMAVRARQVAQEAWGGAAMVPSED